jgi:hypothetical protein
MLAHVEHEGAHVQLEGAHVQPEGARVQLEGAHVQLVIERGSEPIRGTLTGPDGQPRGFSGWIELVESIELVRISSDPRAEGPQIDTVNRCVRAQLDPVRPARGG